MILKNVAVWVKTLKNTVALVLVDMNLVKRLFSLNILNNFFHIFSQQPLKALNSHSCVYWSLIYITNGQAKELPTYKDNDFINDGQKIYIDEENKKMFLEKLRKDVEVCQLIHEG